MPAHDLDFRPDVALPDGEIVTGSDWAARGSATPGHTANHMAYALKDRNILFLRRPCDGMGDLDRRAARWRHERLHGVSRETRAPHGADLFPRPWRPGYPDAPRFVAHYILPSRRRAKPRSCIGLEGRNRYPDARPRDLYRTSIRGSRALPGCCSAAHLEDLVARGLVETDGPPPSTGSTACPADASRAGPFSRVDPSSPARGAVPARSSPRHRDLPAGSVSVTHWRPDRGRQREADRMSTRVPWPSGVMRMTTSSRNPMMGVRATASITPSAARQCRRARVVDGPFAFCNECKRGIIGNARRHLEFERCNVGVTGALERGRRRPGIFGASTRPQSRERVEARGIARVSRDVGYRGQLQGPDAEISRVGRAAPLQETGPAAPGPARERLAAR